MQVGELSKGATLHWRWYNVFAQEPELGHSEDKTRTSGFLFVLLALCVVLLVNQYLYIGCVVKLEDVGAKNTPFTSLAPSVFSGFYLWVFVGGYFVRFLHDRTSWIIEKLSKFRSCWRDSNGWKSFIFSHNQYKYIGGIYGTVYPGERQQINTGGTSVSSGFEPETPGGAWVWLSARAHGVWPDPHC